MTQRPSTSSAPSRSSGRPFRSAAGSTLLRRVRRRLAWHRRTIAAVLAGCAVLVGLQAVRPPPPPTTVVAAAARDLPSGRVLTAADIELRDFPGELVPAGAFRAVRRAAGRTLAGPARAGEPLTDRRVLGTSLLQSYGPPSGPPMVAAPVRIGDAATLRLVQVGDRVDVLAASTREEPVERSAEVLARSAPVLALPRAPEGGDGLAFTAPDDGSTLLLAVDPPTAAGLARAAVTSRLSIVLRRPHRRSRHRRDSMS